MACVGVLVGMDGDVAELVDAEVALAPVADAVGLEGVLEFPRGVEVGGIGEPPVEGLSHQRGLPLESRSRESGTVSDQPIHNTFARAGCNRDGGKWRGRANRQPVAGKRQPAPMLSGYAADDTIHEGRVWE